MMIAALAALAVSTNPAPKMFDVPFAAPGAPYEASLAYLRDGVPVIATCTAPCSLPVPVRAQFATIGVRDGQRIKLAPVQWVSGMLGTGLYPAKITPAPVK